MKKENENWILKSIRIDFEKGYDFKTNPEEKIDRYEGMIEFENKFKESFKFRVRPNMAEKYIKLIAEDIVESASNLGDNLLKSLKLKL